MDEIEMNNEEQDFNLLKEMEQQTSDNIRKHRTHKRLTVRAKVILQSGNSSELLDYKIQGVTGDISEGGCQVMFPVPINVGDVYRFQFDKTKLNLPLMFVRCLRCGLVREDAFEAGFTFFIPISLSDLVQEQEQEQEEVLNELL